MSTLPSPAAIPTGSRPTAPSPHPHRPPFLPDPDDPAFKTIELAQRGRIILDVASADLAEAEKRLGPFHEVTWHFRQALADAKKSWDRLRVLFGQHALEAALDQPPATVLTLGEQPDGSDPLAILLVITGQTYRVRRLPPTPLAPVLWRLDRFPPANPVNLDSDPFPLDPYYPARLADGSPRCDCGEWFFQVAESNHPTGLCKHLRALRALGWI